MNFLLIYCHITVVTVLLHNQMYVTNATNGLTVNLKNAALLLLSVCFMIYKPKQ